MFHSRKHVHQPMFMDHSKEEVNEMKMLRMGEQQYCKDKIRPSVRSWGRFIWYMRWKNCLRWFVHIQQMTAPISMYQSAS